MRCHQIQDATVFKAGMRRNFVACMQRRSVARSGGQSQFIFGVHASERRGSEADAI